jgi:hypothetical protein
MANAQNSIPSFGAAMPALADCQWIGLLRYRAWLVARLRRVIPAGRTPSQPGSPPPATARGSPRLTINEDYHYRSRGIFRLAFLHVSEMRSVPLTRSKFLRHHHRPLLLQHLDKDSGTQSSFCWRARQERARRRFEPRAFHLNIDPATDAVEHPRQYACRSANCFDEVRPEKVRTSFL